MPSWSTPQPYIGVTALAHAGDAAILREALASIGVGPVYRRVMAGILVSARTLAGEPSPSRRYPTLAVAAQLAAECAGVADVAVHYNHTTGHPGSAAPLDRTLTQIVKVIPSVCAIQLNMFAPDWEALRRFRSSHPDVELILQVSHRSVMPQEPSVDGVLAAAGAYVLAYAGVVSHALLDMSAGAGRPLDVALLAAIINRHGSDLFAHEITPGIAGGLGPGCRDVLADVSGRTAGGIFCADGWSLDAESRLRKPVMNPAPDEKHQDRLCADAVRGYLADAISLERTLPSAGAV